MKPNFLNHNRYFSLKFSALLTCALAAWYLACPPVGGHRGNTIYGYTVGTIAAIGIIILMSFGARKRSFDAYHLPLKAWLSFHVWFGSFLIFLVPLHSGFQFGMNIHTAAYVIMAGVILTGIFGAYLYRELPAETTSNRGGISTKKLSENIGQLTTEASALINSDNELQIFKKLLDSQRVSSGLAILAGFRTKPITRENIASMIRSSNNLHGEQLPADMGINDSWINAISKLLELNSKIRTLEEELSVLLRLRFWLYLHVPLALALIVFLVLHIVTVFYYWA